MGSASTADRGAFGQTDHAGGVVWSYGYYQRALGKGHSKTADSLAECYPEWDSFQQICRECDPDGVFLNPHLRELSGV